MSYYPWTYKYRNKDGTNSLQDESTLLHLNTDLQILGIFSTSNFVGEDYTIDAYLFDTLGRLILSVAGKTYCIDINGAKSGYSYTNAAIVWTHDGGASYISQVGTDYYLANGFGPISGFGIRKLNVNGVSQWYNPAVYRYLSNPVVDEDGNVHCLSCDSSLRTNHSWRKINGADGAPLATTYLSTLTAGGIATNWSLGSTVSNSDGTAFYFTKWSSVNSPLKPSYIVKVTKDSLPTYIEAKVSGNSVTNYSTGPVYISDSELYFTSQHGLFKANFSELTCDLIYAASDNTKHPSHPSIYFDNLNAPAYIVWRADNILYNLKKSGATWVENWKNSVVLPAGTTMVTAPVWSSSTQTTIAPIWTSADQIVVASGNRTTGHNLHFFDSTGELDDSVNFGSDADKYIKDAFMIGGQIDSGTFRPVVALNIAEVAGDVTGLMYILSELSDPTTTTTTTTPTTTTTTTTPTTTTTTTTPTTTTTTTTPTTTTTTTTTPTTTTTTTTTPPPRRVLQRVETVIHLTNGTSITAQDGSDNKGSINSIFSESLSLGMLSPGSISETKIISLRLPSSVGVNNIKIGLIDTGGLDFTKTKFYIDTLPYIDYNFIPYNYFQGVNTNKLSNSGYNIAIPNSGLLQSQYVYLNVYIPNDQSFVGGTIRYKWFFDYTSGI